MNDHKHPPCIAQRKMRDLLEGQRATPRAINIFYTFKSPGTDDTIPDMLQNESEVISEGLSYVVIRT